MNLSQSEIKYLRSLQNKKNRDVENKFLLEGWKPLSDALIANFQIDLIAVLKKEKQDIEHMSVLGLAHERGITVKDLTELQLKQLSDTVHAQGVIALLRQKNEQFDAVNTAKTDFIVACDRINDPGNLGTVLRTCDWFGVDTVLLNEGCVSLYNEKVIRSTAGSIFHLKIYEGLDYSRVLPDLRSAGFRIFGADMDGRSVYETMRPEKAVLLLGSEAHGLDPALKNKTDEIVGIPRSGKAESLNVGIACGILLAQWKCRSV